MKECPDCNGSGDDGGLFEIEPCPSCEGSGVVDGDFKSWLQNLMESKVDK